MNPRELDRLMQGYYRDGTPAQLLDGLRSFAATEPEKVPPHVRASLLVFFASALRGDATLLADARAARDGASAAGRAFFDAVIAEASRPARRKPAQTGADLDVRWSEFFATGGAAPLWEIVTVLAWPDHLRAHVTRLLGEKRWTDAFSGAAAERRAALARRLEPLGIRVDVEVGVVRNAADLDCVALLRGTTLAREKVTALQEALPSPLDASDLQYMSTKTSALWSLASNGARHTPVLDVCAEALAKAEGPVRLSLLSVLGHACMARGDVDDALAHADEALAAEPGDETFVALRAQATEAVARRDAKALCGRSFEGGEVAADTAALRARAGSTAPTSFRVLAEVREPGAPGNPSAGGLTSSWDVTFQGDRSKGWRWFWEAGAGQALADSWVTLGEAHYENPGMWIRLPDGTRADEQRALQPMHLRALLARAPDAARRHATSTGEYVALQYHDAVLGGLAPVATLPEGRGAATLWLRAADGVLVAATITAGGVEAPWVEFAYTYHAAPRIEAPAQFLDAQQGLEPTAPGATNEAHHPR